MDGSLASDNRFSFDRASLFFLDEGVELRDMLQGDIIKGLELAEAFQCLVGGEVPFASAFT